MVQTLSILASLTFSWPDNPLIRGESFAKEFSTFARSTFQKFSPPDQLFKYPHTWHLSWRTSVKQNSARCISVNNTTIFCLFVLAGVCGITRGINLLLLRGWEELHTDQPSPSWSCPKGGEIVIKGRGKKKNCFFFTFSQKTGAPPPLPLFWPPQFFFLIRIFWIGQDPPLFGEK